MNPKHLRYTREHEWTLVDGNEVTIGITEHAQNQLGDVVFVELPIVGTTISANDGFGNVESVKSVSELFMPLTGEVLKINQALENSPDLVNNDPYGDGWMIQIRMKNESELDALLSADAYDEYISKG